MGCRKGWTYDQDTMAEAEIKKMTFEKEALRESCWPALLVLRPCKWETNTMLTASSTTIKSTINQICPCDFSLKTLEEFSGPLVPGTQSME